MTYMDQFMTYKCAGDVLNATGPMKNGPKEVSEAMAMCNQFRRITLDDPMEWTLLDLCAGNGLTGLLAAHLLPFKEVFAVDLRPKSVPATVKRYTRIACNLNDLPTELLSRPKLVVSACHACCRAAEDVIEQYNLAVGPKRLVLMPCCVGAQRYDIKVPALLRSKLSKYELWCWYLSQLAEGDLARDPRVQSPCNCLVTK